LVRCRHIRRFIPIHYRSPCRWYLVCALRHWLGRDELRFLLISAMPRYRVGSRWILPSQYISAFRGKSTAAALSARLLATPHWTNDDQCPGRSFGHGSNHARPQCPTARARRAHRDRKSNLASPVQFDNGGGIHVQDLVRCRHIRRFIPIHYRSPCRWYLVCALRHWLGRDELRFLLISAMPRYRVGSRWILPSQYISAFRGKSTAAALSARLLATPHWTNDDQCPGRSFGHGSNHARPQCPTARARRAHRDRKSNLASPVQFDNGGGIHVQDLVRCRHIRRFIPIHYRSPCRWYLVCALRHWLGRDELRFLLISAMPRYRVGSRWILPSQYISAFRGKSTAAALSARLLATPHWTNDDQCPGRSFGHGSNHARPQCPTARARRAHRDRARRHRPKEQGTAFDRRRRGAATRSPQRLDRSANKVGGELWPPARRRAARSAPRG